MNAGRTRNLLIGCVLIALAVAPYLRTIDHGFVSFDDPEFIDDNPVVLYGLSWPGAWWASRAVVLGNWHPITLLSHMLDCDLYRQPDGSQWAGGHHLTNVILHATNTLVLLWALSLLAGAFWRPALVAALFAVHPQHVESVAWIAERKDLLSTLFGFLALAAYVRYARGPSIWRYAGVAGAMLLTLMSKPMWVTLPFVLLLLDVWPLRRIRVWGIGDSAVDSAGESKESIPLVPIKTAVLEKIPLLVLSAGSSVITMFAQQEAGSMGPAATLPLLFRLLNAVVAYATYLYTLVLPINLTVYYPHPTVWPVTILAGCAAVLITISALAIVWRRNRPWLLIGWLLYLGMLVPVIGIVQVGGQFMADRYTYVPATWVFVMVIWSIPPGQASRRITAVLACAVIAILTLASHAQVRYWKDTETLFGRALALTKNNALAHVVMADVYVEKDDRAMADDHFRTALEIRPHFVFAHARYALFLIKVERYTEALEHLATQMAREPSAFAAHHAGIVHMKRQEWTDAERAFLRALELDSRNQFKTRENFANVLIQQGRLSEARRQLALAMESDSKSFEAHNSLGVIEVMEGRLPEAEQSLKRALELSPANWETRANYGRVLLDLKKYDEAIEHLSTAQKDHPERVFIRTNLARALAGAGRRDEAVTELRSILAVAPQFEPAVTLLAELAPPSTP